MMVHGPAAVGAGWRARPLRHRPRRSDHFHRAVRRDRFGAWRPGTPLGRQREPVGSGEPRDPCRVTLAQLYLRRRRLAGRRVFLAWAWDFKNNSLRITRRCAAPHTPPAIVVATCTTCGSCLSFNAACPVRIFRHRIGWVRSDQDTAGALPSSWSNYSPTSFDLGRTKQGEIDAHVFRDDDGKVCTL